MANAMNPEQTRHERFIHIPKLLQERFDDGVSC